MFEGSSLIRLIAEQVGATECEVMSGVGKAGLAGRRILIWLLRRRLHWGLRRISEETRVNVGTVVSSVRAVDENEKLLGIAHLVSDRIGLTGSRPPVREGLGYILEALNEVGWTLRLIGSELIDLFRIVSEIDAQLHQAAKVGVEGERRLDRLIAGGWGDVPQPRIPEDVMQDAEAGRFVEPYGVRKNRPQQKSEEQRAAVEEDWAELDRLIRHRPPAPIGIAPEERPD